MLIDWFTVIAQMVNFLILIALLKRFLYKPLLGALDRREQRIRQQLAEAARARAAAREEARKLALERRDFAQRQEQLFVQAREAADQFKNQELMKAAAQLEARRREWQAAVENEKQQFLSRLRLKIGRLVFSVSQKALYDLAGRDLEKGEAPFPKPGDKVVVRSGFPIDDEVRGALLKSLGRGPGEVEFSEDYAIGFGLILLVGDRKSEWNLARYLKDMEADVLKELELSTKGGHHVR